MYHRKDNKHWANQCPKAKSLSPEEMAERVKAAKACYICLIVGHVQDKCRNKEKMKCLKCLKRGVNSNHSYLLCKSRSLDKTEREHTLVAAGTLDQKAEDDENDLSQD